jgi:DNA-binding Lrp family transcriptional regulator
VQQVLDILLRDGRASPEKIAAMTGLDAGEVVRQMAALEASGIIRRYKAVVDAERAQQVTGVEVITALIDVSMSPEREIGFDAVAMRIARFPEVRSVYLVSGSHDLRCEVTGASMRELSDFVATKLASLPRVTATSTNFVLRTYKQDGELPAADAPGDQRLAVAP